MNQTETPNQHHTEASMVVFANAELSGGNHSELFEVLGSLGLGATQEIASQKLPGFTTDDFRYFESQRSPQEKEEVEYREGLLNGYQPFDAEVDRIKEELKTKPAKEVEGYLASGNESDVFTVNNGGNNYALRITKLFGDDSTYSRAKSMDGYLKGPFRAAHIDGMEKLVGLSYEKGATVGEIISGKPIAEYTAEEIAAIPQEHYKKLAVTVVEAAKAGIHADGNEGNLLYDSNNGFGFVDFSVTATENRVLANSVTPSVFGTNTWLPQGEIPASEHTEDYTVLRDVLAATIPTYEQWLKALGEVQQEMGVGTDYLTSLDQLQITLADLKAASAELAVDGSPEKFVKKSLLSRHESLEKFKNNIAKLDPGEMRTRNKETLSRRMKVPDRIFPMGSVRPSRNNRGQ